MPDIFVPPEDQPTQPETGTSFVAPQTTHHAGFFTTYCKYPDNIRFDTEAPNETILLFLRRDFITNLPWIVMSLLLAIVPTLIIALAPLSNITLIPLPPNFSFVLLSFYYLIVFSYIFTNFMTWYFNVSIITNIRVMDVDFEDIIYKNVAETKISLVQDVSFKQVGAIRTFYDFGDVLIQTAAAVDSFEMNAVPQPDKVVETVNELIGK